MAFSEETIENCNHRFVVATKYVSTCRICGEKKYRYENFAVKIVLGMFGFEPDVWKDEVESINYLHDNALISFAEWFSFMEKESKDFINFSDKKKLELFRNETDNRLNKRQRK